MMSGMPLRTVEMDPLNLSQSRWAPIDVALKDGTTITIPGTPAFLSTSSAAKKFCNLTMPKINGIPRLTLATMKEPKGPSTVTVRRELAEDETARTEIVLPDGCKIVKTKTKFFKAGMRNNTIRPGAFSVEPEDLGNISIDIGPIALTLDDNPAYPTWRFVLKNVGAGAGSIVVPYNNEGDREVPLTPKDLAKVLVAAYEKAVGEAHDFDCLCMMTPNVQGRAILAGEKVVNKMVAAAEKMLPFISVDGGKGVPGDIVELHIKIGELLEAVSNMDKAISAYWNAYQVCLASPDKVSADVSVRSLIALGIALKRSGRLEAAENCYRLALVDNGLDMMTRSNVFDFIVKARLQRGADEVANELSNKMSLKNQAAALHSGAGRCAFCKWPTVPAKTDDVADKKLRQCSGCNLLMFCSVNCQKRYWPEHKEDCRRATERRKELAAGGL